MVPRLLSGQEAHLSAVHTLRRRGQRSLDVPGGGHRDPGHIILSVPAFGRSLYLNLSQDSGFLSEGFVVEERRREQPVDVSRLSTNQRCFYSGFVINHTDSVASMSTCGGLVNPSLFLCQAAKCSQMKGQVVPQPERSRTFITAEQFLKPQKRSLYPASWENSKNTLRSSKTTEKL